MDGVNKYLVWGLVGLPNGWLVGLLNCWLVVGWRDCWMNDWWVVLAVLLNVWFLGFLVGITGRLAGGSVVLLNVLVGRWVGLLDGWSVGWFTRWLVGGLVY